MMPRSLSFPLAGVVVILGLLSAVPAQGQVGWTADAPALATGPIDIPAMAVNSVGAAAVVSVNCHAATDCSVNLARSSPSGGWSLTTVALLGTFAAPDVAIDPAGNVIVVWQAPAGIQAARVATAPPAVPPVTLSAPGALEPRVAMDPAGNAMVAWATAAGAVEVARYSAAAAAWSAPEPLPGDDGAEIPQVALDAAGNAFVVWARTVAFDRVVVVGIRYAATTSTWGLAATLSAGTDAVGSIVIDVDGAGNAVIAWDQLLDNVVRVVATRYTASLGSWGPAATLSSAGHHAAAPALDLDAAGNATALWMRDDASIEGSRYLAATGGWIPPVMLTGPPIQAFLPSVAVDPQGNATFTWLELRDAGGAVRSARFTADGRFGAVVDLATSDLEFRPELGVDAAGNVMALLPVTPYNPTDTSLRARRWSAQPASPTLAQVAPADGSLTVAFTPPTTTEPLFGPLNYEFSLDGGTTWTARSPAGVTSPLVVTGLTNYTTYQVRLRAVNAAGPGAPSAPVNGTPGPGPDPPTGLIVTDVSGNVVTITWMPPAAGTTPTGYVLEGGLTPGEVLASFPTGNVSPGFMFTAPSGAFYIRVHAVSGALRSAPSNEVPLFVNAAVAPTAPAYLLEAANGSDLLLSWTPTFGGGAPVAYVLTVTGSLSVTLSLPVSERFSFAGVPAGTYTFTVAARNAFGTSPPSNPVTITFPASCIDGPLPGTPSRFRVAKVGSTLTVQWEPPVSGRAVSRYRLFVDGVVTAGGPWVFDVETTSRTLSGAVPPGTYTLRVAGVNACFTGVSSPAVTVVVP